MRYQYMTGAVMAADLKRAAHAVRQSIDARPMTTSDIGRPINPRKAYLCDMKTSFEIGLERTRYVMPYMAPRLRHALTVRR